MCFVTFFSTTSDEDFSGAGGDDFTPYRITQEIAANKQAPLELLRYPNRWSVPCRFGGCSCHFRRMQQDSGEWYVPFGTDFWDDVEDEDDVPSTLAILDLVARIVGEGHQVDLLDVLEDSPSEQVQPRSLSIREIPRENFRLVAGTCIDFVR